MMCKGERGS